MSDWEPSAEAVEAAFEIIDCRSDDTLNEDIVRRALIAAHAVAEKEGGTLVLAEREACAKIVDDYRKGYGGEWPALEIIASLIRKRGNAPWSTTENPYRRLNAS